LVGGYAFQPTWGDGHNTGLYSYDYLRRIDPARAAFDARVFQVREGLERCRHHVEDRPVFVAENLLRHLEGSARRAPDQVEHLGFAIAMMFDELVGAVAIGGLYGTIDPGRGGSPDLSWVRDGLVIAGSLLMALGVGMNLSRMLSRATLPYFLIFFTVAALTHANIVALAVVAAALAFIHVSIFGRRSNV